MDNAPSFLSQVVHMRENRPDSDSMYLAARLMRMVQGKHPKVRDHDFFVI
jgi:hypothetical protein